jgi:catalase
MLQFLRLFSDLGTPYGVRHMDGWSGHTYRLVKADGSWVYARVYCQTDQGIKNFTNDEAAKIAGENDAWATADLYDAIERGDYPSWTVGIATKTAEEAAAYRYDVLDLTKDWPDAEYHEIGRITLTQNPENYHAEVEQAHFSPSNMVPGWEASEDPVLQSRLFSYNDAGRYRIGRNFEDLPVNCPFASVANFDRDGHLGGVHGNQGSRPNFPAKYIDLLNVEARQHYDIDVPLNATSTVYYESQIDDNIDYEQPRMFYEGFSQTDKDHLYSNIAGTLVNVDNQGVLDALFAQFEKVSPALKSGVQSAYAAALNSTSTNSTSL